LPRDSKPSVRWSDSGNLHATGLPGKVHFPRITRAVRPFRFTLSPAGLPFFLFFLFFDSIEHLFHKIWLPPLRQPCPAGGSWRMRCLDSTCPETSRIFFKQVIQHYRNRGFKSGGERIVASAKILSRRILQAEG
jgi:hypothetical protein